MTTIKRLGLIIALLTLAAPALAAKPLVRTLPRATAGRAPALTSTVGARRDHIWKFRPVQNGPQITLVVLTPNAEKTMKVSATKNGRPVQLSHVRFSDSGGGSWFGGYLAQGLQPTKFRISGKGTYQIRADEHP